jgi:hypothetical protein
MKRLALCSVLCLLTLTGHARAQETTVVLPGDAQLNASVIKPGHWMMEMRASRPGAPEAVRTAHYFLSRTTHNGKPAFLLTMTMETPRGPMVDSTMVLESGLQPVMHRGHSPMRTLELNFEGATVTGQYSEPNTPPKVVNTVNKQLVFDASALDLILSALPLKAGYRARIPAYIYESNGPVWHDLSVKREVDAETPNGKLPAWEVVVSTPEYTASYFITKGSKEVVLTTAERGELKFYVQRKD